MFLSFVNSIDWTYTIVDASSYLILLLAFAGVMQWLYLTRKKNWYRQALQTSIFYTFAIVMSLSVLNVIADWHARVQLTRADLASHQKRKTVELNLTVKGNRYSSIELKDMAGTCDNPESALRGYAVLSGITEKHEISAADVDDVRQFLRSVGDVYRHITSRETIAIMRNTLHASAKALGAGEDYPELSPRLEQSLDTLYEQAPEDVVMMLQLEKEPDEDQ